MVRRKGRRYNWSPEEEEKLVSLHAAGLIYEDIVEHFPDRNVSDLQNKISRLRKQGVHLPDRRYKRRQGRDPQRLNAIAEKAREMAREE